MPASAAPSSSRRQPDVLRAELQDVKLLTSLIRPVQIAAVANLSISNAGIRVTTELDRSIQAVAYVAEGLFKTFEFTPPEQSGGDGAEQEDEDEEASVDFDINLNTLLDCLTIFSGSSYHQQQNQQQQQQGAVTNGNAPNTGLHPLRDESTLRPHVSLRLQWRGHGHPLILLLTPERDSSSRCEIATFEAAVPLGFQYHHDETQAQVIMSSEFLADAMAGIDVKACEKVQLLFTNSYEGPAAPAVDLTRSRAKVSAPPSTGATSTSAATSLPPGQAMFKLTWSGGQHGGSSDVEFPYSDDSSGTNGTVLEKFTCERQTAHWYRWAHVHHLVKGLQSSLRCSARVARGRGLLSVQLMMPGGGGAGGDEGGGGRYGQKAAGRMGGGMMKSTDATHGFLDFLIAPLDEEGDDNDEEEDEDDELGEEPHHQDDGGHDDSRSSRGASRAQSNSGSASPVPSNRRKRGGGSNVGEEDQLEEEERDHSADKKRRTTRADSLDSLDDEEF